MYTNLENQVNLNLVCPNINKFKIELGWNSNGIENFEIDPLLFMLGKNSPSEYKLLSENHFVFYNNLADPSNTIVLNSEEKYFSIDLMNIDKQCEKLLFSLSIFDSIKRNQNFDLADNIYIKLISSNSNLEIFRYDFNKSDDSKILIDLAELVLENNNWIFKILNNSYEYTTDVHLLKYGFNSTYE